PPVRSGSTKLVDDANIYLKRGVPLDRYIARRGLTAEDLRASNDALPANARFDLSNGLALDTYAPHMPNLRVQPTAKAANPHKPDVIYMREGELTAIQPIKAPEGLTAEQSAAFREVQNRLKEAQILGREVSRQSWAKDGKAVGAGVSNLGLSDMLVNGSIKI